MFRQILVVTVSACCPKRMKQMNTSSTSAMNVINASLAQLTSRIAIEIDAIKKSKEAWDAIGTHAKAINGAGYGQFFGVSQRALLHDVMLGICRIFDEARHGDTASIKQAISLIESARLINRSSLIG